MHEHVIFEVDDLGYILDEIYDKLVLSYSFGVTHVRIFVRNQLAISYLKRWMPGWVRRAPHGGTWVDSKGYIKNIFDIFIVV